MNEHELSQKEKETNIQGHKSQKLKDEFDIVSQSLNGSSVRNRK